MSWFFKSLQPQNPSSSSPSPPESPTASHGGVKDDLSLIGETFGRQLRGVANFLAPPPSPPTQDSSHSPHDSPPSQTLLGIRNDLAEIGGSLKTGLSLFSGNKAVSEISKFTSSFLPFQSGGEVEEEVDDDDEDDEEGEDDIAGITEEVVDFVTEISTRPECWTGFPIELPDEYSISVAQRLHALAILRIVPALTPLRANLLNYMDDGLFWMVYFILLLPRLNDHDSEILSTPQIVETRNALLQKLQNKKNMSAVTSEEDSALDTSQEGSRDLITQEENTNPSTGEKDTEIINATKGLELEENAERSLEDPDIETSTSADKQKNLEQNEDVSFSDKQKNLEQDEDVSFSDKQKNLEQDEDVSFSDLEDDDNDLSSRLSASRKEQGVRAPSPSGSSDWDQLHEALDGQSAGQSKARGSISHDKDSDGDESNDWLKVDDFD